MGWKLFAGLNVLFAIAASAQFALGYMEPTPWHIMAYIFSLLGTVAACLYAFDAKILSRLARKGIAISFSIFAVVEVLRALWFDYFKLGERPVEVRAVLFFLPLFLSVFSVIAARRYSEGRTVRSAAG